MRIRTLAIPLLAGMCLLLQGCLTQGLWKEHRDTRVVAACDAVVTAVYEQGRNPVDGQATLLLQYRLPRIPGTQETPDDPLPGPSGLIALRAPEFEVRSAVETLARMDEGGRRVRGFLTTSSQGSRQAAVLTLFVKTGVEQMPLEQEPLVVYGTWSLAEAEAVDADCTPVPLAEPLAFRVVDRRVESNTATLVLLTPVTVVLDACAITCGALGRMGH